MIDWDKVIEVGAGVVMLLLAWRARDIMPAEKRGEIVEAVKDAAERVKRKIRIGNS